MTEAAAEAGAQKTSRLRSVLPFVVSAGILGVLFWRTDVSAMAGHMTPRVAFVLIPTFLGFAAYSMVVEVATILTALPKETRPGFGILDAAKTKAASYLIVIINIGLGAGALALLLRRRAGVPMAQAAGAVFLFTLFDALAVFFVGAVGIATSAGESGLSTPAIFGGMAAIAAGFVGLRLPISMGPVDRIRNLEIFRPAKEAPVGMLARLAVLRVLLVGGFIGISILGLLAFDIEVPLGTALAGFAFIVVVGTIPVSAAGLGTGQAAFLFVFGSYAPEAQLLACSLTFSLGMIVLRAGMGLVFAGEYTREALAAARSEAGDGSSEDGSSEDEEK